MFDQIAQNEERNEEERRRKDAENRQKEMALLDKIDKKNEVIHQLRSSQEDFEAKSLRLSQRELTNTFDRLEDRKSLSRLSSQPRSVQRQLEKEKQDKEQTLMEAEDFRMRQIMLEEKRLREIKELEAKYNCAIEVGR